MLSVRHAACCAALGLLATSATAPLAAQASSATLHVIVTSAATGEPLPAAQVLLAMTGVNGMTGPDGELHFNSVLPGIYRVEVRRPGYAAQHETLTLLEPRTTVLRVALVLKPIPLEALHVKGPESRSVAALRGTGFFRRQAGGFGAFVTRADLERLSVRRLSDALRRIPGLRLASMAFGDARASMGRSSGTACPIQYFVDGVPVHGYNIDDMPVQQVEAMEIYRGASEVPPDFNYSSAMCGVIVIWTRVS